MQTPPSAFHRPSRERLSSRTASHSLDRIVCSTPSPASEFSQSAPQPLRRSASELSHCPQSVRNRYMSRRLFQGPPSATLPQSSSSLSSTNSSALDGFACRSALHAAGAAPERENTSSPASGRNLDARWSPSGSIMSSDQLVAFREFLDRRAEDALAEARSCVTSPDRDHGSDDFCEDVASDCSEYGESIRSGRRYSLDEPDISDSVDGKSATEDLWSALSITRAVRTWDSSDNYSLLANGDTFLDLHLRSSSPASQLQAESPNCRNSHVIPLQSRNDPQPRLTDSRGLVSSASTGPEEIRDFLPNFLDLCAGVDLPESVTDEVFSGCSDLHFLQRDERLARNPEGSLVNPSLERNPRRLEGDRPDRMLAKLPPATDHSPRRVQSAAELVSSHSRQMRPLPSNQGHSQPWSRHSDLQHDDPENSRPRRQASVRTTGSAEATRATSGRRRYDDGTSVQAEYSELALNRGKAELDSPPRRGDSYYAKRVQDRRGRDSPHPKPELCVAVDPKSPRESLSREVGSVSQRQRAMTLQEVAATGPPAPNRLRRSATTKSSAPSTLSFRTGGRYRTLEDRAYRHPDVPHSPLCSDLDHAYSPQYACGVNSSPRDPHHGQELQVPSPETMYYPSIPSPTLISGEVYSGNASSRSPVPRAYMSPFHSRNDSYPIRNRPAQTHVRRPGSSLDSRPGSPFVLVSPPQGVGLSLIDNGAFEAPRPAPEPRAHIHDKASSPSPTVQQEAPVAAKKPTDHDGTRDSYLVLATSLSLTGFGGLPRRVWSRKQKQSPPRSDGLVGRLGLASNSEADLKSSFMSMVEDEEVKPQRKGLLMFKRK